MISNLLESMRERKFIYALFLCFTLVFILVFSYFSSINGRILNGITVSGIKIGGLKIRTAATLLTQELKRLPAKKVILNYNHRNVGVVLGAIGFKVDIPATIKQAYFIGRTGSIWSRIVTRTEIYRRGREVNPVVIYNQATLDSFYRLLDASIAIEPVRSVLSVNREGKVFYSPSRIGRIVEYQVLTQFLEEALYDKSIDLIDIPIKTIVPPLNEIDIKNWGLDQVLGIFSTKYDPTKVDRVQNLKIASSAIDNSIVYPGQNFSFNTWVGPRASEAGYREAPIVFLGKLVPGIGGGICQVSTTLYNAVLMANLKVVQRQNHTIPSSYIPLARDATVVYGGMDFIFENTNQKPILLVTIVDPPYVTVAILGEKSGWEKVSLESNIIETYPFKTIERPDPGLYQGERVRIQNGQNGYKVELWRKVQLKDGVLEKNLENISIYPAQPEEYKIGTKRIKERAPRSRKM